MYRRSDRPATGSRCKKSEAVIRALKVIVFRRQGSKQAKLKCRLEDHYENVRNNPVVSVEVEMAVEL